MTVSIVGFFARRLGLETLKGIVKDNVFEMKSLITHYYETDMKTIRPLFSEYLNISEEFSIPLLIIHRNQRSLKILENINFDFLVSNCYKYKIPKEYLEYSKIMSINMHRSLLPKYKGLKPLKKAIENKEKETGTTIHIMTPIIDSGEIIDQYPIKVDPEDNVRDLFQKLYPTQYPLLKRAIFKVIDKYEQ